MTDARACEVDDCNQPHKARGLCGGHYWQQSNGRPLTALRRVARVPGAVCSLDCCDKPPAAHLGLCNRHYQRKVDGDPDWERPLRAKRPDGDGSRSHGYVRVYRDGRLVAQHRLAMEETLGRPLLPEESVHHRNGARSDNRAENLELWSRAQPYGQRVEDKVAFAMEMLRLYRPDLLCNCV